MIDIQTVGLMTPALVSNQKVTIAGGETEDQLVASLRVCRGRYEEGEGAQKQEMAQNDLNSTVKQQD